MRTGFSNGDQLIVDINAVGITGILETFADAIRTTRLEQANRLGIVPEEIAVFAVGDIREQFDDLSARSVVTWCSSVVDRFDGSHGNRDITLQGRLGFREQALARLTDLALCLLAEHDDGRNADHQRKYQHRQHRQRKYFGFQANTHRAPGISLFLLGKLQLTCLTAICPKS